MSNSLIKENVRCMTGYTPGEQPKVSGLIKLNTNENPYPPSPGVIKALRAIDPVRLRLYPDPVSSALRKAIARLNKCSEDMVFVGNGSDEILALCTRAFVEDNGSIGYFNPSYSLYPILADIRDVAKKPVELAAGFEWAMPAKYNASLFLMARPNAPTGMNYPLKTVSSFCAGFKGVVMIDEAYADFASDNCMALARTRKNVLVMRTLSKSFSLAGLRVGYVIGHKALIAALFTIKDSYNVDFLAQTLALAAVNDVSVMKKNCARIIASRRRLATALEKLSYTVCDSQSNFLFVKPVGMKAAEVFGKLREEKILVRYFPGRRTGDFLRITVGTDAEVNKLISVLKTFSLALR